MIKDNPFESEKPLEIVIEGVSNILGNSREEILYNIENKRHNNITTSYELMLKRYRLNLGTVNLKSSTNSNDELRSSMGFQSARNKTVDSFKEQTKNINININYVNKIGNININISDPQQDGNNGINKLT